MLSCKKAITLISSEEKIRWYLWLELKLHLMICYSCRTYSKQIHFLKRSIRKLIQDRANTADKNKINSIEEEVIRKL